MFYPDDNLIIKAGKVLDPGGSFVHGQFLHIRHGRIESMAPRMDATQNARFIDCSAFTIAPPYHDHHVHFSSSSLSRIDAITGALRKYGIFSVDEGGDSHASGLAFRERTAPGFHVNACGFALYRKGGYGGAIGKAVESTGQARQLIDELVRARVDYVKIINSGIFVPGNRSISAGGFESEKLTGMIQYINDRGLAVTCHANGDAAVRHAVESGATRIIHGFLVSEETLYLMKDKGFTLVPTVGALNILKKGANMEKEATAIDDMIRIHLEAIRKASDIGVHVVPGSDAGPSSIPYGASFRDELMFFRSSGLSMEKILSSACRGSLRPGTKADLIVLDELEPVDIEELRG